MPDRLLLRLDPSGSLNWLRQAADGRVLSSSQSGPPPASVLEAPGEIVVLVPAEQVLLVRTRIHARNRAQLLQAVPYAIEDQLLGAVEDLHFAVRSDGDDQVGVAVVARSRMKDWLEQLAAAGIRADVVLPDSLALPVEPDRACAMIDEARALLRLDRWSGVACTRSELPAWLTQIRASGMDRALDVHDFGSQDALQLDGPLGTVQTGLRDPLAFLARNLKAPAINLLSGEFASSHRQARGERWWRRAGMVAAACLVLAFVHRGIEVGRMSRALAEVDADLSATLQTTFPDLGAAERTRAPQAVMQDRLERLRGGSESSGMLRLMSQIAPLLGRTTRTQVRGLEYRNGVLEVGLRSPDVATLDSMREQFAAIPGLSAEVTASVPVDSAVDGRIRIRGVTP
jgi:general secretion pathway protein L